MKARLAFGLLLSTTWLTTNASAQRLLHVFHGTLDGDQFGESLLSLGDVNGDGVSDFLIGQPNHGRPGLPPGQVHMYSGIDMSLLYTLQGLPDSSFGHSLSPRPDIDGDGVIDFLVGAPTEVTTGTGVGSVSIYSGANGAFVRKFPSPLDLNGAQFGWAVSDAGDVNADGTRDLIVGSNGTRTLQAFGAVHVISGVDGSTLYSELATHTSSHFGYGVSGHRDVNNDGFDDFVVGNPFFSGSAKVHSGLDSSALQHIGPPLAGGYRFGGSLATGSDINGDGIGDLIIADGGTAGSMLPPSATVHSGVDGSRLLLLPLNLPASIGPEGGVSFLGDQNGDGIDEILMGRGNALWLRRQIGGHTHGPRFFKVGVVRVYSGADGAALLTINGTQEYHRLGHAVAAAGDLNGDGYEDFLASSVPDYPFFGALVTRPGEVRVYAGGPPVSSFTDVCNGDGGNQLGCGDCPCGNAAAVGTVGGCLNSVASSAKLTATGSASSSLTLNPLLPEALTDLRLAVDGCPPNSVCLLRSGQDVPPGDLAHPCYGLSSGSRSIHFDGLRCLGPGRILHSARAVDSNGMVGTTNEPWGGEGGPPIGIANFGVFLSGQVRHFQAWYRDDPTLSCGRGANTTQAVRIVFEP